LKAVDFPAVKQPPATLIGSFEGLRGACALLVVFFHFSDKTGFIGGAYLFVDVFFVLSGYIMMLNYGERVSDARSVFDFLVKRLARIYPLFVFTTVTFVIASLVARPFVERVIQHFHLAAWPLAPLEVMDGLSTGKVVAWVTLSSSLGAFDRLFLNFPAWSIGTEFWTYVVFAAALMMFRKRLSAAAIVLVAGALSVTCYYSAIRHDCLPRGECLDVTYDAGLFRCIAGFFLGVLAYKWNALLARGRQLAVFQWLDVALLSLLVLIVWASSMVPGVAFAMPLAAAALVTVLPLGGAASRLLSRKPFLWLGRMSFAIYLGHMSILIGLDAFFQTPLIPLYLKVVVLMGSVALFAMFAHRFVEEPARRLIVGLLHRFMGKTDIKPVAAAPKRVT
jgi:peptidoglycan/LPS O-acetylase OafA/YrhL